MDGGSYDLDALQGVLIGRIGIVRARVGGYQGSDRNTGGREAGTRNSVRLRADLKHEKFPELNSVWMLTRIIIIYILEMGEASRNE
jgi:hypothetical protein